MSMKLRALVPAAAIVMLAGGCRDFLDVNTNPNAPTSVTANLYLPPMIHWLVTSPMYDGRFVGRYTQEWTVPVTTSTPSTWDRMGYDPSSDNGGQQWRDVYWTFGQNLVDMMTKAQAEQRWDLLGVGQVLKAWGWQVTTDLHGEIIIKEAFDQTRFSFDYDSQEYAYQVVDSLLGEAIKNLKRNDGAVDQIYLARGDRLYNGDRTKWLKFAYGLRALSRNHFTNKAGYNAAQVIAYVDSSFASNADDAVLGFTNADPAFADYNFLGQSRNNFSGYRQTQFAVALMDGTDFGVVDPRLSRMLSPSPDGQIRGLDPNNPNGPLPTTSPTYPNNFFGAPGTARPLPGRYLFDDKVKMPVMTYAQLQFVKAEAAYRKGDRSTALQAYRNAISSHIDFVNSRLSEVGNANTPQISATEKATFMSNPAIVPTDPNALTLTQIMSQKYIAQWGWGHNEMWMDMRRYHYTDTDPATGKQVFPAFAIPTNLYPDNAGKPAYRIRPRYNSEYVWNKPGLSAIGGLDADYQTKPLWIIQP
jgi:Starch-binding associating with outer membrane